MFSSGDEIDPDSLTGLMGDGLGVRPAVSAPLVEAAHRGVISPTALPGVYRVEPNVQSPRPVQADPAGRPAAGDAPQTWPTLADVERVHLEKTLAATMHNKSLAAKILGIDRSVLRRKLQRYGLDGSPAQGDDAEE
jgi:DNA-binding NtrC family response regulator